METDTKLLEKMRPICGITTEFIVTCMKVKHCVRRSQQEDATFVATESTIYLVSKVNDKRQVVAKFHWHQIVKVTLESAIQLQINHTSGGIMLQSNDASIIATRVVGFLQNILPKNEMPQFEGQTQLIKPTPHDRAASYYRLVNLIIKDNVSVTSRFLMDAREMMKRETEFDFVSIGAPALLSDVIVRSVAVEPKVTMLSIPKNTRKPCWSALARLISCNSNPSLRKIVVQDQIDITFGDVIKALKEAGSCQIEDVTFTDSNWTLDHVSMLSEFISNLNLDTLTLNRACDFEFLKSLMSSLTNNDVTGGLRCLVLERMENIDVLEIYRYMTSLEELQLNYCNMNVSEVMNQLPSSKLSAISVYGGKASTPINKAAALPKSLSKISLCHVMWEGATFADVWVLCMRHKPGTGLTDLNLSEAIVPDVVWDALFKQITGTANDRIWKLRWDMNPLHPRFYEFLKRLPNLRSLSICGCLRMEKANQIMEFQKFIEHNETITALLLEGKEDITLRMSIRPLLEAIAKNRNIESLSVANQNFGDAGLEALQEMLTQNRSIANLILEGNRIESPEVMASFYEAMLIRACPLNFKWPHKDFEAMLKKRKVRSAEINRLKRIHKRIQAIGTEGETFNEDEEGEYSTSSYRTQDYSTEYSTSHFATKSGLTVSTEKDQMYEVVGDVNEWQLPYPEIPAPDNTEIMKQMAASFSLDMLVQTFYSSQQ